MRKNIKKIVAVAMAATMVVGVVAFADNPASDSGTAEGTGSSNGHLEQKVVSVLLPTSVGTTFDYIADPEDLVGKTEDSDSNKGKTKTGTEVTPNADYIYFHNAAIDADADKDIAAQTEGYSSTSDTVRVINKSSADIKLTVEATVEANDDNMAIADVAADLATATTTPTVHFDLLTKAKGAGAATSTAVTTTDGVSKAKAADITVTGTAANFEITQNGTGDSGEYKYSVKSDVKDKDWDYVDISLKGACSKAETTDTLVAPKFELTWSWVDPTAPAAPSITTTAYDMEEDTAATVSYSLGLGDLAATGITSIIWIEGAPTLNLLTDEQFVTTNTTAKTFTLTKKSINNMIAANGDEQTIKVTFDDGTVVNLTFNDPS